MLKFKMIIVIVFFVSLFSLNCVYSLENNNDLVGKTIYVDPGHGVLIREQCIRI
jgi:glyoxylase-like metal-dependent hydrolase (beta-lactamase superfamily II)